MHPPCPRHTSSRFQPGCKSGRGDSKKLIRQNRSRVTGSQRSYFYGPSVRVLSDSHTLVCRPVYRDDTRGHAIMESRSPSVRQARCAQGSQTDARQLPRVRHRVKEPPSRNLFVCITKPLRWQPLHDLILSGGYMAAPTRRRLDAQLFSDPPVRAIVKRD